MNPPHCCANGAKAYKAHNNIYRQCIQGEHFKTIQQNHNSWAWKLSRKLYPGSAQLVSPRMRSFGAENSGYKPGIRVIKKKKLKRLWEHWPDIGHRIIILEQCKSLPELPSCNIWCFTWEAGSAEVGSWRKEILRPLLCLLSNTCWNRGVHPLLRYSSKSPFSLTLTHLSQDPTPSDGETCPTVTVCVQDWETMTICIYPCVRICVSEVSCSSGRSCHTGRRRTCHFLFSSSSSLVGPSLSHSAPPW